MLLGTGAKVMLPVIGGLVPVTKLNVGTGAGVGCRHCIILQHGSAGSETIWQLGGGTTPSKDGHLQKKNTEMTVKTWEKRPVGKTVAQNS